MVAKVYNAMLQGPTQSTALSPVGTLYRLVAITSLISSSLETCSLVSSNLSCGARLAALVFICWVALFQCKPESLVNGIPIHHWGLSHRFYRSVGHVVNMRT